MRHDPSDVFTEFGNFFNEFLQEYQHLSARTQQQLAELNFNFVTAQLENTRKQLIMYTPGTSHRQWLSGVSDLAGKYGNEALGLTRNTTTVLSAYREGVIALLDKGFLATRKVERVPVKRTRRRS
jgi:hypothetical protein